MRTFAIVKKVLSELFRDKRTLIMMFMAPVLIMWLLNIMFSANTTTDVQLATINLSEEITSSLAELEPVHLTPYTDPAQAEQDLKDGKIDSIIQASDAQTYSITYANYDPSKTMATRQLFTAALTKSGTEQLKETLSNLVTGLTQLKSQLPPTVNLPLPSDNQEIVAPTLNEYYVYGNGDTSFFTKMIPSLMGFIVFFFVFLISGMALLKERTSGTLDRLLATPVRRSEIVFGYMISYGIVAFIQTIVIVLASIYLLDIQVVGSIIDVIIVNILLALVALSFGFFLSTLAKSEFQMMQFIPIVVMPQMMFSGIIPLDSMAEWVQVVGKILPLSYSSQAMNAIIIRGENLAAITPELGILACFIIVLTILNIEGLRRYRKV